MLTWVCAAGLALCSLRASSVLISRHSPGRGIVSKLMRNDTPGNTDCGGGIGQIWAQLFDQRWLGFVACQQPAVSGEGVEKAEEA